MKPADLQDVIRNAPITILVFQLSKSPTWCELAKGDVLYLIDESFVADKNGLRYCIGASYVEFIRYEKWSRKDWTAYRSLRAKA
jgi:hypothetical protein